MSKCQAFAYSTWQLLISGDSIWETVILFLIFHGSLSNFFLEEPCIQSARTFGAQILTNQAPHNHWLHKMPFYNYQFRSLVVWTILCLPKMATSGATSNLSRLSHEKWLLNTANPRRQAVQHCLGHEYRSRLVHEVLLFSGPIRRIGDDLHKFSQKAIRKDGLSSLPLSVRKRASSRAVSSPHFRGFSMMF